MSLTFGDNDLFAELTKDGGAVKCGWPGCNCKMAPVMEKRSFDGYLTARQSGWLEPESYGTRRFVWFEAAWAPGPDGVWEIGRRALERLKAGRTALTRRLPNQYRDGNLSFKPGGSLVLIAAPALDRGLPRWYRNQVVGFTPWNLPIEARCPHCNRKQWLTAGLLRVDANIVDLSKLEPRIRRLGGQVHALGLAAEKMWKRHPFTYRISPAP